MCENTVTGRIYELTGRQVNFHAGGSDPMARNNARQRLISTALDLFYREGFHAVGLDRIIAETGVTKTTLYNHFPSKDDLIVAVIEEHGRWWQGMFRQMLKDRAGEDPREQIRAVFSVLQDVITDDEYRGCIFLNAAVQFPLPHDPAHQASLHNELGMQAIIDELAEKAGADDPADFAQRLMILMGGSLTRHLLTWDLAAIHLGRAMADDLIAAHLPPPPAPSTRRTPAAV